jgi:hypothetical protein
MTQVEIHEIAILDEPDVASERSRSERQGNAERIAGILTSNASLLAWLLFLGFGGAFLALYYANIHYLPDLEWDQSFSYLAAMSILGGGITLIYGSLLFFPGVIWSEFLIFDTELQGSLCYMGKGAEPCFLSIGKQVVLPFAILMGAVHVVAPWGLTAVALTAAGVLAILTWYSHREFSKDLRRTAIRHTDAMKNSLLLKYVATVDVAALLSVASLLLIYRIVDPNRTSALLLMICTGVVVISNSLVAVQFRHKPGRAIVTGILAAFVLLTSGEVLSDGRAALSTRLMEKFGFGTGEGITLSVNDAGREVLVVNGLHPAPFRGGGTIREAHILSRLGTEYFIEAEGRRVAIPKNMVLSWSTESPPPVAMNSVDKLNEREVTLVDVRHTAK